MKITFLLPSNCHSGGVRVTMQMANGLLDREHTVRIACQTSALFSRRRLYYLGKSMWLQLLGISESRWLQHFRGRREAYQRLDELSFEDKEIVIATGEQTIGELNQLERDVVKLRYCHGFVERDAEQMRLAWGGRMRTIGVSPGLVPTLEQYCPGRIVGVVPNGISPAEYFVENRRRDGVGLIFSQHPIKGPEVAVSLVKALAGRFPGVPCHVFGASRRLRALAPCAYTRFPSIAKAREIYNRCKIWLVTSQDEGFCLPILEAMACGCAVVSSRHTNAAELLHDGVNGFTVPYGDISRYLTLVERILADETLRERIVGEGFKTVRRFPWESAVDRMEQVLVSLTPEPVGAPRGISVG